MLKSHESGRGYSPIFMTLWFGEVGGRSQQTTDGANTSAADRNSLAALYVLLIICTWQHVPSWASRHVSCHHLASSWLGPSGRPRPTNQTHHSSVQRPPRGRNTSWNAASSFFYWLKNILNSFSGETSQPAQSCSMRSGFKLVSLLWWISHRHAASPSWPHKDIPVRSEQRETAGPAAAMMEERHLITSSPSTLLNLNSCDFICFHLNNLCRHYLCLSLVLLKLG